MADYHVEEEQFEDEELILDNEQLPESKLDYEAPKVVELRLDSSKEVVQIAKGGGCSWK